MTERKVQILMGSDSDAPTMQRTVDLLKEFNISCHMTVASAHRSPGRVEKLIKDAPENGVKVFVVGAGAAAHLAGVVAAHSTLPLLATVQMPPGVPVATVSVGNAGATNAAVLAAQILALTDEGVAAAVKNYKEKLAAKVEQAAAKVESQ